MTWTGGASQFVGQERQGLSVLERGAVCVSVWQDLTQRI